MANPFQVEENLRNLLSLYPTPDDFRKALSGISRQSREYIVRLWLTEGIPYAFRDYPGAYEEMRNWLASYLDVCPKEITLLGSARIGFSLAGAKFGTPFNKGSDLDLSVVSAKLFQTLADAFDEWRRNYSAGAIHPRNNRERTFWDQNLQFGESNLPLGFFDANKLPTFDRYPIAQKIQQAMWVLTKKLEVTPGVPSPRRASVRVYQSWQALVARVSLNLHVAIHPL